MKVPDRVSLQKRRSIVIADLLAKAEAEDWHGVADAAMDLREIDAQLAVMLMAQPARYTVPNCPHLPLCLSTIDCRMKSGLSSLGDESSQPAPVVHEYVMSSSEAPDA